jgi:hypothetical protein
MKPSHRIFPLVLGLFCAFTLVSQVGAAHAKGGKGGDTVSKVVEINKQALANIQAGKFDAARDALWNAVTVLTDAGLAEHEISARTHVHLAAVYLTGFKDKSKAVRQFVMALKINPNIKITPQVDTPELTEAMDTARIQMAGGGSAPSKATPAAAEPAEPPRKAHVARKVEDEEPSPPSKVKDPLFCPLATEVPPNEDIMVRCVTQKKSRQASATLFYREAGSENFTPLPMVRSHKGWLAATVPGSAVTGTAFSFYISANIPGGKDASLGSADSPTLLPIVSGASPMNNTLLASLLHGQSSTTATAEVDDSAPLKEITDQYKVDEDLRKYRRRHVGSVFVGVGGGMGMTYHQSVKAAGSFNDANGKKLDSLGVGAGTNPASLFQLLPEIGYVVSETFAISLQGRLQYLPFDSSGLAPGSVKPPTLAMAGFLRGQYNFFTIANFQSFVSLAVGGGPHVFMGNIPKSCDTSDKSDQWLQQNPWCTKGIKDHSNVVLSGPIAAAAGIGFLYHLTRNLGFWLEARGMSSVSPIMFLGEVNAGLSVALKFDKSAPPPSKEGEGGWEAPPEDKPLFETPPSD